MQTYFSSYRLCLAVMVLCIGAASGIARAQNATPSAAQMVEQLKASQSPSPAANENTGTRTRSLRNLAVEAVPARPETTAQADKPSLSLLIQFDFNSARIKSESQPALSNLALALQSSELGRSRFAIEGHTDGVGRADYNLRLSRQRADAVRDLLVRLGVPPDRLDAKGLGDTELANPGDPTASENRRVRIVNLD